MKKCEAKGLTGLSEAKERGAKPKCQDSDIEHLVKCLEEEPSTYDSKQFAKKLKEESSVDLSSDRLRRLLTKNGYRWKRTRTSHKKKQDLKREATKQVDLEMLKIAAFGDETDLKYLDEARFCLESSVSYSLIGEQKRLEQPLKKYGKQISILGLWQERKALSIP